ncbi:MAG TPA: ATP-binding protein, partial [Anaerovoracaceae bacterium]|nr:ATP-binding protein [Anaerovoracaceae bacterium]
PLDGPTRLALLQILEDRYGKKSVIMTSQLPVGKWHDYIGESTIADYPHFFIMRSRFLKLPIKQSIMNN